jgi:hypothetical protein
MAETNSNAIQNRAGGSSAYPNQTISIIARIPEIIFGILLLILAYALLDNIFSKPDSE